jgi:Holliday junction resolvasome RuvABC endonuclease subunit
MAPRVVALDLSLTATGVASEAGVQVIKAPAAKIDGPARLVLIRDVVMRTVLEPQPADVVVLENYSFGQQQGTSQMHSTGELGGVIRVALYEAGIPYVEIAPGTLKTYATGNGAAKKPQVISCARERLGYTGYSSDEADAMFLRALGLDAYGCALVELPILHRRAIAKVSWPVLAGGFEPVPLPEKGARKRKRKEPDGAPLFGAEVPA